MIPSHYLHSPPAPAPRSLLLSSPERPFWIVQMGHETQKDSSSCTSLWLSKSITLWCPLLISYSVEINVRISWLMEAIFDSCFIYSSQPMILNPQLGTIMHSRASWEWYPCIRQSIWWVTNTGSQSHDIWRRFKRGRTGFFFPQDLLMQNHCEPISTAQPLIINMCSLLEHDLIMHMTSMHWYWLHALHIGHLGIFFLNRRKIFSDPRSSLLTEFVPEIFMKLKLRIIL